LVVVAEESVVAAVELLSAALLQLNSARAPNA